MTKSSTIQHLLGLGLLAFALPLGCTTEPDEVMEPAAEGDDAPAEDGDDAPGAPVACGPLSDLIDGSLIPTGVPQLDTFFDALGQVQQVTDGITLQSEAALDQMAEQLGVSLAAAETLVDKANLIAEAILSQSGGSLGIAHGGVECVVDTTSALPAAQSCASSPDEIMPSCGGECMMEQGAESACEGTLMCEGSPPGLECTGDCAGPCVESLVAQECAGTCTGICDGTCDGSLTGLDCTGTCDGTCTGLCEGVDLLGGACGGECLGDCTWEATDDLCGVGADPLCAADVGGSVDCFGSCMGMVGVDGLPVECIAPVEAIVNSLASCPLPPIDVDPIAAGDMFDTAEDISAPLSELLSSAALAEQILQTAFTAGGLLDTIEPLMAIIEAMLGSVTDADQIGTLTCAVQQLGDATEVLSGIQADLGASMQASVIVDAAASTD